MITSLILALALLMLSVIIAFVSRFGRKHCQGFDGPCPNEGVTRRQNTAYVDNKMNWVTMCDDCFKFNEEHWDEMWTEYYSGRL